MPNDNKGRTRGSVWQFDERVNCILLLMFLVVASILTAKGCSEPRVDRRDITAPAPLSEDNVDCECMPLDSTTVIP